jgi:hypothetical protein
MDGAMLWLIIVAACVCGLLFGIAIGRDMTSPSRRNGRYAELVREGLREPDSLQDWASRVP